MFCVPKYLDGEEETTNRLRQSYDGLKAQMVLNGTIYKRYRFPALRPFSRVLFFPNHNQLNINYV